MKWQPLRSAGMCALAGALLTPGLASAANEKVTYYEHVAPIIQANCQSCHQPAGANIGSLVAPMSLTSYEEARPWAKSIAKKVQAKEMPPWFSDTKGVFSNERGLTDKEINTILAWVNGGAVAGDRSKAPAPVAKPLAVAEGGYTLGKPDLIIKMPKPYFVDDDAQDVQGTFHTLIPEDLLPADVHVRAYEFRAGTYVAGKDTVHHMCGGVRPPGFVENPADDAEGEGASGLSMGCVAGGAEPTQLPPGFGMELKKGSTVTFNMHYYKQAGAGTGYWNQSEIGFYFVKEPIKYKVQNRSIGTTGFEIPPQKEGYKIGAADVLEKDTLFLAYWPHAHLRATAAKYTATYPDGRKEVLLDVPRYDQSWQITYNLNEPKLLPKGTRIDVEMLYDNSADRAAKRQFNPNISIQNGPRTQDEMMLGFVRYVELEPGQQLPTFRNQQQ